MDTLTHITFGATLGGALFGRRAGLKPYAYGALIGTLPDVDAVFMGDGIADLLVHRGVTHALFYLTLAVPLLVFSILALHRDQRPHWRRWAVLAWLVLITHSLLDMLNPYGVQLLLPFSQASFSLNAVYVVDPLITLPLLLGLWLVLRRGRPPRAVACAVLAFCVGYVVLANVARWHVQDLAEDELLRQGVAANAVMVMPTPFNTLLWRILAVDEEGYYEGYYSLVAGATEIPVEYRGSDRQLLAALEEYSPVQQLSEFARGFLQIEAEGDQVVVRDLRLGQDSYYPVSFVVAQLADDEIEPVTDRRVPTASLGRDELVWLWRRIWTEQPS